MQAVWTVRKIIWAVDLFSDGEQFQIPSMDALRALALAMDCSVEPVCVVDSNDLPAEVEPLSEEYAALRFSAHAKLRAWLSQVALPGLLPAQLLLQKGSSVRDAAKTLGEYVAKVGADLVVVNTHARHGLPRLIHGSFAEALLHLSPLPVLLSNPETEVGWKFEEILFPTDLSLASREVFDAVVGFASQLRARIVLLHLVDDALPLLSPVDFMAPAYPTDYPNELFHEAEQCASDWQKRASQSGVETRLCVLSSWGRSGGGVAGDIASCILNQANAIQYGLVCMTCKSSSFKASVAGSTTHQILRHAHCPVLVLHGASRARVEADNPHAA